MPIQEQNIVFVESQVMDDVPEGGGAATGSVIADGVMNNIFEDVSDLDRAYGRFSLRKIFLAVRTLDRDLFGGAKTVVTALPTDDALSYTLFSSNDPFDTRSEAADRVASYLYKGPMWQGYLYEAHIAGMRTIAVIQKPNSTLPPIGKTLCLTLNEGALNEIEQYVRVTEVSVAEVEFTDGIDAQGGDQTYSRWIVSLSLSDALRADFPGHTPARVDSAYSFVGKTRIRDTTVADAASYYGAQRLATAASIGDTTVRAASMFASLVPSSQSETPIANRALVPTATLTLSAGSRQVEIVQQAHTDGIDITAENRAYNYVRTLNPLPGPGALNVAYRANGNWYELADNGSGTLSGSDPAIGGGTVNYTTGSTVVTLGALPDVGSTIIYTWAAPAHYVSLIPDSPQAAQIVFEAPDLVGPLVPGSITVTWRTPRAGETPGSVVTATDATAGVISGNGMTGTVDYTTPRIEINAIAADIDSTITVSYSRAAAESPATNPGPTTYTHSFGHAVRPRTVQVRVTDPVSGARMTLTDLNADGNLVQAYNAGPSAGGSTMYWTTSEGAGLDLGVGAHGTIDYATGAVTITTTTATVRWWRWQQASVGGLWQWVQTNQVSVPLHVLWDTAVAGSTTVTSPGSASLSVPADSAPHVRVDLAPAAPTLIPGSLELTYGGKSYLDRAGKLYTDITPINPGGIEAGTVNYATLDVRITWAPPGATGAPTIISALGRFGDWTATEAVFRTEASPIKPQSLSITATTSGANFGTSEQISGTSDADGVISGAYMLGRINYEMGVARVQFGAHAAGAITTPRPVEADSVRYNAVSYRYLPLDADILGIDAVRLPADGRVPIYRPGDLALVMHTAETAPQTVTSGAVINCGRARLAWVRVLDADGDTVTANYTLDRELGTVTITDATGITMPITVRHTVADLRQITDAQITGELTLARPLTHSYPADESIVASCLIHGDRRARVSAVWDQQTWDGTWSDTRVGSEAIATLDTIAYPVQVTNEGAETERWLLRWTSTTNVELIGQRRGLVFSGPFTADIAPINPRTRNQDGTGGAPYLRIPVAANGGGWSTGNVVRINTVGALADIWIARSIQQSDAPSGDGADGVEIYALGNVDRP